MRVAFTVPDGQAGFEVQVDAGGVVAAVGTRAPVALPPEGPGRGREPCAGVSVGRLMPCLAGPGRLLRVAC